MSPERAPRVVGLVADDLTGAADAAVGFAEAGWRSDIVLDLAAARPHGDVDARPVLLAVNAQTRHADAAAARARTAGTVTALRDAGAERLFVKIDSTMRGSVAAQIEGALEAWTRPGALASAVICPAFPAHGRTVVDGDVRVHGEPVHLTAAGTDPVAPVGTAALGELIPGAAATAGARMLILDAETDTDLARIAARVAAADDDVVAVGSGGLAAALAAAWRSGSTPAAPPRRGGGVLVAVSSLHPVSSAQIAHVRPRLSENDLLLTPGEEMLADPEAAADVLARRVVAALADRRFGALVLVGGDGAAAVLAALRAERIVLGAQPLRGCPAGTIIGGAADGLAVVTKSGGFGDDATLGTLLDLLGAAPAGLLDLSSNEGPTHD
ncbi:four-carbon acid sugar kinase family protein [Microbacterium sp. NPDC091313]